MLFINEKKKKKPKLETCKCTVQVGHATSLILVPEVSVFAPRNVTLI